MTGPLARLFPRRAFARPRLSRLAAALVVLAVAATAVARADDDGHGQCVAEQQAWLEQGLYRAVPDRAAFAAETYCRQNGERPSRSWAGLKLSR